jgi:hypothetical protein
MFRLLPGICDIVPLREKGGRPLTGRKENSQERLCHAKEIVAPRGKGGIPYRAPRPVAS